MPVRRTTSTLALAVATALGAAWMLTSPSAVASENGGGVLFFGFGSGARIQGLGLTVDEDEVELPQLNGKNLRLEGRGSLAGGGVQANMYFQNVRVGTSLHMFNVEGTTLRHAELSASYEVSKGGVWGGGFDGFVGYEFTLGPVRPYVDLVAGIQFVALDVDLKGPLYGTPETTRYGGWMFGTGPRVGVSVPLSKLAFIDVSGMYSVVGMEQFRVVAGIGLRGK